MSNSETFPQLIPPCEWTMGITSSMCWPSPAPQPSVWLMKTQYERPRFGKNVYVNSNSTWIDTCEITIGSRTLIGPNCSFFSGTHPLDPTIRNGTRGPESGKPITVGEDCWIGGNCIILPGVTIGKGSTVGAGSVVTKDVPPYHCVVGNPARILRKIEVSGAGGGEGVGEGDKVQVLTGEDAPPVVVRGTDGRPS